MSNADAYGSLTALFTSGGGSPSHPTSADGPRVGEVTVVLVGNLPVMAGLWTTQFADEVARAHGPTALVRCEREDVTLELLRADGRQVPPPGAGAVAGWLPRAAAGLRRWVACVPAEAPPVDAVIGAERVVLLMGADEAAVTGSYLRLKQLSDECTNRGHPLSKVGVAIAGASPEQADQAYARLGDAVRSFLGIETDLAARLPRIERVESSARATYPAAECPGAAEFLQSLRRAREAAARRFDDADEPPAPIPIDASVHAKPAAPTVAAPAMPAVAPAAPPTPAVAPAPRAPVAAPVAPAPAAPAPAAIPAVAAAANVTLPARLVPLLRGLRPLGLECPSVPEIELALDDEHRLHVVGRADQLARVRAAHAWATAHRELLGLAFADLRGGFEIRERIVLDDARQAVPLHGTGVLLDVVVRAETPSGAVQVVLPLNDAASCGG
ncbi:MAG: hypothetical protein ACKOF7_01340 [Phycisphaerales bacterium]